jgi:hypothetical protein
LFVPTTKLNTFWNLFFFMNKPCTVLFLGCLISGCDRSDTEPDLARGCFEAALPPVIIEGLTHVSIPDSIVERTLVEFGLDTDGYINGRISMEDAELVKQFGTGNANVYANPEYSVRTFKGTEYFSNLEFFGSNYDLADSIDLSHNLKLKRISISHDVGGAVTGAPLSLRLSTRTLRYINLGENENLQELRIINSSIKELDVSGLPNLETLEFAGDSLKIIYIRDRNQIRPDWKISFSQSVDGPNDIFQYKVCNISK